MSPLVRTRGGLLVGIVFALVVWFELRTVIGMFLGVSPPPVPYMVGGLLLVGVLALVADAFRTAQGTSR